MTDGCSHAYAEFAHSMLRPTDLFYNDMYGDSIQQNYILPGRAAPRTYNIYTV